MHIHETVIAVDINKILVVAQPYLYQSRWKEKIHLIVHGYNVISIVMVN